MPRAPRRLIIGNDTIFHATWKVHNGDHRLKADWAKTLYIDLLCQYKNRYQMKIFGYSIMDNHVHLCGQCKDLSTFSNFFCVVHSQFSRRYNLKTGRSGQVIMDRMRSPRIEDEASLYRVLRYIDLNPKRAGKVSHPRENRYSSYGVYAYGRKDRLVDLAPQYRNTGARRAEYRAMVEEQLDRDRENEILFGVYCIGKGKWVESRERRIRQSIREQVLDWERRFKARYPESS